VVEIDAASHGGVDDARELRERASFAPVRDRYKVFIIDEAHMVTSAGFNALLKLVEEPPEHVKFVFATTEPDKVIGTIRSRTHHYPFRLIPPQVLGPYLEEVCAAEQVSVGEGVMPLVVRAGGGSARDSMSVLDQLMAGAAEDGLDFPTAIALLGFTDTALLDTAITAIAQRDAAALYGAVEHVLVTGHEPRRFVEDLLERMRDLIVLAAVPDRGADLLPQVPADELESMRGQATLFAPADLSQCGDLVHETLSTMSGATSPRLHLELLAARLVLRDERAALAAANGPAPSADQRGGAQGGRAGQSAAAPAQSATSGASGAREEARRIAQEKVEAARQARGGREGASAPAPAAAPAQQPAAEQPPAQAPQSAAPVERPAAEQSAAAWAPQSSAPQTDGRQADGQQSSAGQENQAPGQSAGSPQFAGGQQPAAPSQPDAPSQSAGGAQPAPGGGGLDADQIREHWSAILDELQQIRRPSWALISQNGHVHGAHGSTLVIGFRTEGLVNAFHRGTGAQNLADAVRRIVHTDVTVEAVVGEDPGPGSGGTAGGGPGSGGPAGGGRAGGGPAAGVGPAGSGGPVGGAPAGGGTTGGSGPAWGGPGSGGGPVNGAPSTGGPSSGDPANGVGRPAQAPARWGDAVSAAPTRGAAPSPAGQEPEAPSAGQRASDRAMQAAARAAQSQRPGPASDPVEDFPPEPDDPFPPDPQDDYQPRPRTPEPVGAAAGPAPEPTGRARWSDALHEAEERPKGATAQSAATSATAQTPGPGTAAPGQSASTEIPEVEDEGRDSLPPEEPRTFGQNALRRALAEGRVIRSRAAQTPAPDDDTEPHDATPAAPESARAEPTEAASAEAAPADAELDDSLPVDTEQSATARAAASWGTASTVPAPQSASASQAAPAAQFAPASQSAPVSAPPAGAGAGAAGSAPSAPRSGAALVREAAQASRTAGLRTGARSGGAPAAQVADTDPTGGATRDDEDAVSTTRNGREVVEKLLGGKVLEIIDENKNY